MKKAFLLLTVFASLASLSCCCGSKPAPLNTGPAYVAPVK